MRVRNVSVRTSRHAAPSLVVPDGTRRPTRHQRPKRVYCCGARPCRVRERRRQRTMIS